MYLLLHGKTTGPHQRWGGAKRRHFNQNMGAPPEPSGAVPVGRGGARECAQLSPQAEAELNGLCDDEVHVGNDGDIAQFFILQRKNLFLS